MNNNIIQLSRCVLVLLLSSLTVLATAQIETNKSTVVVKSSTSQTTTNQATSLAIPTTPTYTYGFVIEDDIMQSNEGEGDDNIATENGELLKGNKDATKNPKFSTSLLRELTQEIKIYPIPANTFANIDLGKVQVKTIDVVNSLGQKIYSQTLEQQFLRLDISTYQAGIYFIQMTTTANQVLSKSIVVN